VRERESCTFSDGGTGVRYVGNKISEGDVWDVMRRLHQGVPCFQNVIRLHRAHVNVASFTPYHALFITTVTAVLCEELLFLILFKSVFF